MNSSDQSFEMEASTMIKRRFLAALWMAGVVFALGTDVGRAETNAAVPLAGGAAVIGPENTKLQFVCAHVGTKPDPRKGGFAKFSGKAQVDAATKSLKSFSLDSRYGRNSIC
jgi:hypothetical protein